MGTSGVDRRRSPAGASTAPVGPAPEPSPEGGPADAPAGGYPRGSSPTAGPARRLRRVLDTSSGLLAALLASALSWLQLSVQPTGTVDSSWQYVITHAAGEHLRYGHGLVWTFGPLGWLAGPVAPSVPQLAAAVGLSLVLRVAGFLALGRLLRRALPGWLAYPLVVLAAVVGHAADPELLGTCLVLVVLDRLLVVDRRIGAGPVVLAGLTGGAALTMKLSVGELVTVAALCLALAASGRVRDRWSPLRYLGVGLVSVAAGLLAAWVGTGQRLADLKPFLRGSQQIQSGYQTAMTVNVGAGWEWFGAGAGFALLVVFALVACLVARGRRLRAAAAGLTAVVGVYYLLLQAFVRHGPGHDLNGQSLAVLVAAGFVAGTAALSEPRPPVGLPRRGLPGKSRSRASRSRASRPRTSRRRGTRVQAVLGVACAVVLAVTYLFGAGAVSRPVKGPDAGRGLVNDIRDVLHPGDERAATASALAALRPQARYPAALVAALRGRRAVPVPWDITGMVAHGIVPASLPVPQTYSAYTPYLDRLNAAALRRPGAPPVLRRANVAIDGRDPMWESPQFMTDLVCDYRQTFYAAQYQLLVRVPARCVVAAQALQTVSVPAGGTVVVPRPRHPGAGIVMTFTVSQGLGDRVLSRVARATREWWVRAGSSSYRVVPGNAGQPMIVTMPPGLWSPAASAGGNLATLRFSGTGPVVITFRELLRVGA